MKVGDLAKTRKGNLVLIVKLYKNPIGAIEYCDVVFCKTGYYREGFPYFSLVPIKGDSK